MRMSWFFCQVNRISCALTTMCIYTIYFVMASTYFEKMGKIGGILRNNSVVSFGKVLKLSENKKSSSREPMRTLLCTTGLLGISCNFAASMYRFATARSLFHVDPAPKGSSGFLPHNNLVEIHPRISPCIRVPRWHCSDVLCLDVDVPGLPIRQNFRGRLA